MVRINRGMFIYSTTLITSLDFLQNLVSFLTIRAIVEQFIKNKKLKVLRINTFSFTVFQISWCHQESNRGHMDFQSIALPTELWHLLFGLQIYISNPSNQILSRKNFYLESF
jgi:hypothetical protein